MKGMDKAVLGNLIAFYVLKLECAISAVDVLQEGEHEVQEESHPAQAPRKPSST